MVGSRVLRDLVDVHRYPIDRPDSDGYRRLVERCRGDLAGRGMYELSGFLDSDVVAETAAVLAPRMASESSEQRREHNIYFLDHVDGLAPDHPALTRVQTINHTLCADQLVDTVLIDLYEWPPFREFIAATMEMPVLYLMDDPLARVNVLSYRPGEALNWHFDRSVFTTTLLLQAADEGGIFEYRRELRTEDDPCYDAVGRLIKGDDPEVIQVAVEPGALNVFRGRNTAHRVTTVEGDRERMVAVFSLYQQPGVMFSDDENLGFYGRTAS
ncbi:MAG: 2OG-Fe(II) oxygenase [Acidimicrobiia bacterium]|nr:2OG-Fe(II) oxygenase [Acidimicrobiia bacterium]